MTKQILVEIHKCEEEISELTMKLSEKRANLKFKCGCGKLHKIKDCVVIQSHWYTRPSGCSDGDYWNEGELQIICPATDVKNRAMFSNYDVAYENRNRYAYNAEKQFSRIYKPLFKAVIDDYNKDKRNFWNIHYFDENHKKFGLHVEGRNYAKQALKS